MGIRGYGRGRGTEDGGCGGCLARDVVEVLGGGGECGSHDVGEGKNTKVLGRKSLEGQSQLYL